MGKRQKFQSFSWVTWPNSLLKLLWHALIYSESTGILTSCKRWNATHIDSVNVQSSVTFLICRLIHFWMKVTEFYCVSCKSDICMLDSWTDYLGPFAQNGRTYRIWMFSLKWPMFISAQLPIISVTLQLEVDVTVDCGQRNEECV